MADMCKKPIELNVNHMMADTLGFQYGVSRGQVEEYAPEIRPIVIGKAKEMMEFTP